MKIGDKMNTGSDFDLLFGDTAVVWTVDDDGNQVIVRVTKDDD